MARSAARRFPWERLARTDSEATIHATLGTLYLRRLHNYDLMRIIVFLITDRLCYVAYRYLIAHITTSRRD